MIHLNHNATAPVLPEVLQVMRPYFCTRSKPFIVVLVGAGPFPEETSPAKFADGAIVVAGTC
jgi:hypothetical protein